MADIPGLITPGNVDLYNRPMVPNGGDISTVRSKSWNFGGKEVLLPTVSDDGRLLSDEQAKDQYRKTGKHLGIFDTPEHATSYAHSLHEQQEQYYRRRGMFNSVTTALGATVPTEDQGLPQSMPLASVPSAAAPPGPAPTAPAVAPAPPAPPQGSKMGRAFRSMLGAQVDYQQQPDGTVRAVPVKMSGSQLFRGVLAAALLGGEAAEAAHREDPNSGFAAGAVTGGGAVIRHNQLLDAQRYQRAEQQSQQSLKARQEQQKLDMEKQLNQAQIAHLTASTAAQLSEDDLRHEEYLDRRNDSFDALADAAKAQGNPSVVTLNGKDINGKMGNVYDYMQAVQKDPSLLHPASGVHRIATVHVDHTGLTYKTGKGWVDKDGNNVDMAERTTVTAYDVADSALKTTVQKTGAELNKMLGSDYYTGDAKSKTYSVSVGDLVGMTDKGLKEKREELQNKLETEKIQREIQLIRTQASALSKETDKQQRAEMMELLKSLGEGLSASREKLKAASASFDPAAIKEATDEINAGEADLKRINNKLMKDLKLENTVTPTASTAGAASPQPSMETAWAAISHLPPAEQAKQIQSASGLSDEQKRLLLARVQTPQPATPAGAPQQKSEDQNALDTLKGVGRWLTNSSY